MVKNKEMITKTCEFCQKKFETDNPRQKYCKTSCKSRAYEVRKGKDTPSFLVGNEYDIIKTEVQKTEPNPVYKLAMEELEILKRMESKTIKEIERLNQKLNDQQANKLPAVAGIATTGFTYELTPKIKNEGLRWITAITSGIIAAQLTSESKIKKARREELQNMIVQDIKELRNELSSLNRQIFQVKTRLARIPEEITKTEILDKKIPKRQGHTTKSKKSAPFVPSSALAKMEFDLLKLDGQYGSFLGKIANNSFITSYGTPGSGKSTFFIKLADYFTKYGMVLYVTPEEGVSPTFAQKLNNHNISNDNIHITGFTTLKEIRKSLKDYDYHFCFIDSINMITDTDPTAFEKLRSDFPDVLFAIILQSTKDGKFKGSNEYAHNSDINIKVDKGKAETIKNRYNELSTFEIF